MGRVEGLRGHRDQYGLQRSLRVALVRARTLLQVVCPPPGKFSTILVYTVDI